MFVTKPSFFFIVEPTGIFNVGAAILTGELLAGYSCAIVEFKYVGEGLLNEITKVCE